MPGKKKKAGGKKAGGKKGKGKKGGKGKSAKLEKALADPVKNALANAHLWESRLLNVTQTRDQYRESTRQLLFENDKLQTQVAQTEKDTIDVISFLKKEDVKKDDQIEKLQTIVKDLKREFRKEKQGLINEYTSQIQDLQQALTEKSNEVKLMQSELKLVKEFRRKRAQMQKELDDIKDHLYDTEKEHKSTLNMMERKFLEEKIRLQEEASRKISDLAERAHTEAVSNLDETTKSIYKENVRLNESLGYHVKSAEDLSVLKEKLVEENKKLKDEKELNSLIVEEKIVQTKELQKTLKEQTQKVAGLEATLTKLVKEQEEEKKYIMKESSRELEKSKIDVVRAERTLELKNKEMNKIRKLARSILDQRSEVEMFFLDSLEYVKGEITKNRIQYRRDAEEAYNKRMLAAHAGHAKFPKVRTFNNSEKSTNSIYQDLRMAEDWQHFNGNVDISDLTWEQRERVIRLLFAKMNGAKNGATALQQKNRLSKLPPIETSSSSSRAAIMDAPPSQQDREMIAPPTEPPAFLTEGVV